MRLLLDVNVWVALFDESHVHNPQARALVEQRDVKIATCALTETGVIRVLNVPRYGTRGALGFDTVRRGLATVCDDQDHEYWPSDISLRDPTIVDWNRILGHNQITDAYLLALAVHHGGALATFDHRVALSAVRGASARHLMLL